MQITYGGNPNHSERVSSAYIDINSCGYHHITDTTLTTLRPAGRSDYQLIYLWRGRGQFHFASGTQWIQQGQMVLFRPGETQHYSYFAGDQAQSYWIHFSGIGCEELLAGCGLCGQTVFDVGPCVEFTELIGRIIREFQLQQPQYVLNCRGYFLQLLAIAARRVEQHRSRRDPRKYERLIPVIEAMHNECHDSRGAAEYAAMCHLSVSRFLHLFKQYTGTSPHLYKTGIRMEKARELLNSTTLSIAEISRIVGYADPLYFSRIFKQAVGMAPSVYREQFLPQ